MKYKYVHPPRTSFCSTYTEILPRLPSRGDYSPPLGPQKYSWDDPWQSSFSPRIMKYMIFTPSRRTFVAPSGDVFCSTYNEISTFSPTGAIASGTTIGPNRIHNSAPLKKAFPHTYFPVVIFFCMRDSWESQCFSNRRWRQYNIKNIISHNMT